MELKTAVLKLKKKKLEIKTHGVNRYAPDPWHTEQMKERDRKLELINNVLEVLEWLDEE